ncbi:MAG: winged helix-turn-helix domain-containing protein [Halobacteriales archaeon]
MAADDGDRPLEPAGAFETIGNEIRIAILRALIETDEKAMSFTALRDQVGVTDSGRFNYHLQRLTDHFIEETDDGYTLRYPGRKVAHAVLAGTFNERAIMDPIEVEGSCHSCGAASLVAAYRDERFSVTCDSCEAPVLRVPFPPSAVSNRAPPSVVSAFDRWSTGQAQLATAGVCPECGGEMQGAISTDTPEEFAVDSIAKYECTVCQRRASMTVGAVAFHHPTVQAFYYRRDRDPRSRPYWTIPQLVTDQYTTLTATDPLEAQVEFTAADESITAVVTEATEIVTEVQGESPVL